MSLVVNTNIGSLNALRSLASSGNELKTAIERLSFDKKINKPTDNAGARYSLAGDFVNKALLPGFLNHKRRSVVSVVKQIVLAREIAAKCLEIIASEHSLLSQNP